MSLFHISDVHDKNPELMYIYFQGIVHKIWDIR